MKRAVDFDKTLAEFDLNGDEYVPGKTGLPIPKMVDRVRRWLSDGDEVVIFTARMWSGKSPEVLAMERRGIEEFCMDNFGQVLELTSEKCPGMDEIWDDKAIRIEANTGEIGVYMDEDEELGIGGFL